MKDTGIHYIHIFLIFLFMGTGACNRSPVKPGISGTVIACGQGLQGVTVHLVYEFGTVHSAETDSSGTFIFPENPKGTYSVSAYREGFHIIPEQITVKLDREPVILPQFEASATWGKVFGGRASDTFFAMVPEAECGCTVAGYSDSYGNGSSDLWIVRLDMFGAVLWEKTYKNESHDGTDIIYSMIKTSDNGYAFAGYTTSPLTFRDFWIVKLDEQGGKMWDSIYGNEREDIARSIYQTDDGGYIVGGHTWSGSEISASRDAVVLKFDAQGVFEKGRVFDPGDSSSDYIESIVHTDGGYVFAGYSDYFNEKGESNLWIARLDSYLNDGEQGWQKVYSPGQWTEVYALCETADKGFAVAGLTRPGVSALSDSLVVKVDTGGEVEWSFTEQRENSDVLQSVIETADRGFITAGYTVSSSQNFEKTGDTDFLITRLDSNGQREWDRRFGGEEKNDDMAYSIIQTQDGGYIVVGTINTFEGDDDGWVIKLDKNGDVFGELEGVR